MEVYNDGSEKANFNLFSKRDILTDNMEFDKISRNTSQSSF
jgi:hypothetical protein